MYEFLEGKMTPAKMAEVHALIDELGLIPDFLVTPSLLQAYRVELRSSFESDSFSSMQKDFAKDFLDDFHRRYHSRPKQDDLFVQLNFEFES